MGRAGDRSSGGGKLKRMEDGWGSADLSCISVVVVEEPCEISSKRHLKPTRSGLHINRMVPEFGDSPLLPLTVHAAAAEAALAAPRRKRGKAAFRTLPRPQLLSWSELPDYLRDNEFIKSETPTP